MSLQSMISNQRSLGSDRRDPGTISRYVKSGVAASEALAIATTKAASRQTHLTIRFLVDQDRVADAYRAYGYFRWVDDWLDDNVLDKSNALAFVSRQQALVDRAYRGNRPRDLSSEERMLFDLVQTDDLPNSPLQAYVRNMMSVMAFDAERRGRLILSRELSEYTRHLAVAVTEALHYFIGHDDPSPQTDDRYCAVTAAHITHMLRDTYDDIAAGYFNIPGEFLELHQIHPDQVQADAYREWVKSRVQLARASFGAGREYLARVRNNRCRLAGYAYMARFEGVLDTIEQADYRLLPQYVQHSSLKAGLKMVWSLISHTLLFSESRSLVTPQKLQSQ